MSKYFLLQVAPLALLAFAACGVVASSGNGQQSTAGSVNASGFGYSSASEALEALRKRSDVLIGQEDGWTIVLDKANFTIWRFTPSNHPAHPAGVKKVLGRDAAKL